MKSLSSENPATAPVIAATAQSLSDPADALLRARAFAEPLLASAALDTGENILAHADAVAGILKSIGGSQAMQAASYLVYACDHLNKPHEVITKAFGSNFADLAMETTKLVRVQRMARLAQLSASHGSAPIPMAQTVAAQTESVRKMLLAFSRDLRVVMLRLASRLQTLRHFAATKLPCRPAWPARRCRCLRRWQTAWAFGKSSGKWKTCLFVFWSRTYREVAACWMKSGWSAKPMWSVASAAWPRIWRARAYSHGAGASQAHLQHCQKDARQVAGL
jgi:hypothetical protein